MSSSFTPRVEWCCKEDPDYEEKVASHSENDGSTLPPCPRDTDSLDTRRVDSLKLVVVNGKPGMRPSQMSQFNYILQGLDRDLKESNRRSALDQAMALSVIIRKTVLTRQITPARDGLLCGFCFIERTSSPMPEEFYDRLFEEVTQHEESFLHHRTMCVEHRRPSLICTGTINLGIMCRWFDPVNFTWRLKRRGVQAMLSYFKVEPETLPDAGDFCYGGLNYIIRPDRFLKLNDAEI